MSSLSEDIIGPIEDTINSEQNTLLRERASALFHQWKEAGLPADFCKSDVTPAMRSLNKSHRRRAQELLSQVREIVSEVTFSRVETETRNRRSIRDMATETANTYRLIEQLGRGVVFFGSARTKKGDKFYEDTRELGYETSRLLGSTIWTGAGPGQMEAPLIGATEAGGNIAGVKIRLTNEESSFEQDVAAILPPENVVECNFFGPRKIGLVDAAMRHHEDDRTGIIVTPGGYGTLDEFFEFVVLKQLKKLGTQHPVPITVMNYDGFYDDLIRFLSKKCVQEGTISEKELDLFKVCRTNKQALDHLADTYKIPMSERPYLSASTKS